MHPELLDWVVVVHNNFCRNRKQTTGLVIQTNGIKLESIDIELLKTLIFSYNVRINISVHSTEPKYKEIIDKAVIKLQSLLPNGEWRPDDAISKSWVDGNHSFRITDQSKEYWVNHYNGHGSTLMPGWDFDKDRKSTRLNSSHGYSRMPSSA